MKHLNPNWTFSVLFLSTTLCRHPGPVHALAAPARTAHTLAINLVLIVQLVHSIRLLVGLVQLLQLARWLRLVQLSPAHVLDRRPRLVHARVAPVFSVFSGVCCSRSLHFLDRCIFSFACSIFCDEKKSK